MTNQNSNSAPTGGVGFFGLLGLLFIGLKLGHVVNWPWWLVTLPLWGGLALVLVIVVVILVIALASSAAKR